MTVGKTEKKCPKCDSSLHYVEQVGQHYCFSCEAYFEMVEAEERQAEEEKKEKREEKKESPEIKPTETRPEEKTLCPSCGEAAVLMEDTNRYYCYSCEDYIDSTKREEKRAEEVKEEKVGITAAQAVEEKPAEIQATTPAVAPAPEPMKEAPATIEQKTEPPETVIEKELEKEERRACQDCGSELIYVQKYDRWYCRNCRKYAPKEGEKKTAIDARKCPTCGGDAKFIDVYNRWYCYSCKAYLPTRDALSATRKQEGPFCPYCGKPLIWIKQYERYYCYSCKKYPPTAGAELLRTKPEGPICPDCGRQTTWIQTYERYYCYPCRKYVQASGESKAIPDRPKKSSAKPEGAVPMCESCGKPTTWISQYQRYYCYPCKKYAPLKSSKK